MKRSLLTLITSIALAMLASGTAGAQSFGFYADVDGNRGGFHYGDRGGHYRPSHRPYYGSRPHVYYPPAQAYYYIPTPPPVVYRQYTPPTYYRETYRVYESPNQWCWDGYQWVRVW